MKFEISARKITSREEGMLEQQYPYIAHSSRGDISFGLDPKTWIASSWDVALINLERLQMVKTLVTTESKNKNFYKINKRNLHSLPKNYDTPWRCPTVLDQWFGWVQLDVSWWPSIVSILPSKYPRKTNSCHTRLGSWAQCSSTNDQSKYFSRLVIMMHFLTTISKCIE